MPQQGVVLLLLNKTIFLYVVLILSSNRRDSFSFVPLEVLFLSGISTTRLLCHNLLKHLILLIQVILLSNLSR